MKVRHHHHHHHFFLFFFFKVDWKGIPTKMFRGRAFAHGAMSCHTGRKEMFYLSTHSTFYLRLYGVGYMV